MKITVASDVLVCAVLRDDEARAVQAEKVLKQAELIAVSIPTLCEFVEVLQNSYSLDAGNVGKAVRSLLNASNVVADRSTVAAGLALLGNGGTFAEGVVAFEGQRLGANNFISFTPNSMARIERMMPHYR